MNNTTQKDKLQALDDKSATGRKRPWRENKMLNQMLALTYELLNDTKKAERLKNCAKDITFKVDEQGKKHLSDVYFCRVRLCPMCQWRRGLKLFSDISKIINHIKTTDSDCAYLFATLTLKNCEPAELRATLNAMTKGYKKLIESQEFERPIKGWFRSLEVTHNIESDTYHPHYHVLLCVSQKYFKSRHYISQKRLTDLWQRSMKLDYTPVVDIRKTHGATAQAIAEVAKYTVKPTDYIVPYDMDISTDTVKLLDDVLHRRRLVAYGGNLKQAYKDLKLIDADDENTDLIHIEGVPDTVVGENELYFSWHTGYKQYYKNTGES